MSGLRDFLVRKRAAIAILDQGPTDPTPIRATCSAEGSSGIRRIRIRDFQLINDSPPSFAGFNLGPTTTESQLGLLAACLNHSVMIQAVRLGLEVDDVFVEIDGYLDPRAGRPGLEHIPAYPQGITYTIHVDSPADDADRARLLAAVEQFCPILNLLRSAQTVSGGLAPRSA